MICFPLLVCLLDVASACASPSILRQHRYTTSPPGAFCPQSLTVAVALPSLLNVSIHPVASVKARGMLPYLFLRLDIAVHVTLFEVRITWF